MILWARLNLGINEFCCWFKSPLDVDVGGPAEICSVVLSMCSKALGFLPSSPGGATTVCRVSGGRTKTAGLVGSRAERSCQGPF